MSGGQNARRWGEGAQGAGPNPRVSTLTRVFGPLCELDFCNNSWLQFQSAPTPEEEAGGNSVIAEAHFAGLVDIKHEVRK